MPHPQEGGSRFHHFLFFHKKESEVDQRLFFLLSELGVASTLSRVRIQQ